MSVGAAVQQVIFIVAVTAASRFLLLRDRIRCFPKQKKLAEQRRAREAEIDLQRQQFPSGRNVLDAVLVMPRTTPFQACLLLCHGIGETVEHWQAAQMLLAEHGVASLVFNYSGYGQSTGWISAAQCECDAIAAFRFLERRLPGKRISLLGYSLGSGIAAAILRRVPAHTLVLCAAYTSFRDGARRAGLPGFLIGVFPDLWDSERALRGCSVPVVIVQGEQDRLFPPAMARQLARACDGACELMIVRGVSHNGPIFDPQPGYWSALIARL